MTIEIKDGDMIVISHEGLKDRYIVSIELDENGNEIIKGRSLIIPLPEIKLSIMRRVG